MDIRLCARDTHRSVEPFRNELRTACDVANNLVFSVARVTLKPTPTVQQSVYQFKAQVGKHL
jgi:hypothetical protein